MRHSASYAAFAMPTDPQFGAVDDGVRDDTAATQATINYIYGGNTPALPRGFHFNIDDDIFVPGPEKVAT
jgi:polygalacturonase